MSRSNLRPVSQRLVFHLSGRRRLPFLSSPSSIWRINNGPSGYFSHSTLPSPQVASLKQLRDMSSNKPTTGAASNKRKHGTMMTGDNSPNTGNTTVITEGSATMSFPSEEESTVFYNPVQVQNRDLSILMITLYAERRKAARTAALRSKREKSTEQDPGKETVIASNVNNGNDNSSTRVDGITVLEALAASGLRSIRYWNEIPDVRHVTINDLEKAATERAHDNLARNELQGVVVPDNIQRPVGICVNHGDATHEMYMSRTPQQQFEKRESQSPQLHQQPMWDVIDLDPYGSAAPFLDAAVQAIESGGLLCVTCTDMAALGGSHPETAYGRYGALPIQSAKYLQELALRILLYTISVSAARYGRTIRPILSVGMDFYIRVFVEIHNDKKGVTDLSLHVGNVYQSSQCSSFFVLPHGQMGGKNDNVYQSRRLTPSVCPETGATFKIGGPLWLGPMHDQDVVKVALDRLSDESCQSPNMKWIATRKRLLGLLTSVSEELETPLFYTVPGLSQALKCSSPSNKEFKAALTNAGYRVSGYHKEPTAIKTDAPDHVVWDVMRAWVANHPLKKPPQEGRAAAKILAKEPSLEVDFTNRNETTSNSKTTIKVSRFPQNPERHWGPKKKASGKRPNENVDCS